MKRPSFQFYPADWKKDPALSLCSIAAKGLWIEMMCIAHQSDDYGRLTINGGPMTLPQIARLVGDSPAAIKRAMAELEAAGVFSRDEQGIIFSRRMVRDEDIRNRRAAGGEGGKSHGEKGAEHGSKGGRPPLIRGVNEPPLNPPPSSSSSISSSPSRESEERAPSPRVSLPSAPIPAESLEDRMPTENAKGVMRTKAWINAMHPSWRKRPAFTYAEDQVLSTALKVLSDIIDTDWQQLRAYMDAAIPEDWGKFWQPESRTQFMTSINDLLTHSDRWAQRCKRERIEINLGEPNP